MPSQRLAGRPFVPDASGYKYKGIKDENIRPHEQCEMENDDTHEVHPTVWPPQRVGNQGGTPTVTLQCVHCGAWCIAQREHATGELPGLRVVLPQSATSEPEPERRGPGRPKKVLA